MRTILGCVAVLALSCGVTAADEPIDFNKLVGKWELVEPNKGPMMTLEFSGNGKINVSVGETGKEVKVEGQYRPFENNKLDVTLKFMGEDIKESLIVRRLTSDELMTEDSKGKTETFKKKK